VLLIVLARPIQAVDGRGQIVFQRFVASSSHEVNRNCLISDTPLWSSPKNRCACVRKCAAR
jgi:hypothetical protein